MIVGTVAYMAPEQCAGDVPLTPAADWYALGVVLFQALTGRLPFEGAADARAAREADRDGAAAVAARARHPARPRRAVRRAARARAGRSADRARSCCAGSASATTDRMPTPLVSISRDGGFAGRDAELAHARGRARAARAQARVGRASCARRRGWARPRWSRGSSSACARPTTNALLLRGRCLEREDVPYKAIDHLIDELSRLVARADAEGGAGAPAARRVPAADAVPGARPRRRRSPMRRARASVADPQARRTHAFEALRETLQRLGDRHTVVLFLDDMQWVDRDTTTLLADLMRAPDPPPLLARARDARRRQRAGARARAPDGRRADA